MMVLAKAADQVGFGDELELLVLVHNATTRWKGGGGRGEMDGFSCHGLTMCIKDVTSFSIMRVFHFQF